jgi:hypothetical protein
MSEFLQPFKYRVHLALKRAPYPLNFLLDAEIWATKSLQYSDGFLVLVFTEEPSRRFVREHHEDLKNNHNACRDECSLPVFQVGVAAVTLFVVNAKKVRNEDADGDKEFITASKEALQFG